MFRRNLINQTMLLCNTARPMSRQVAFKRFWFTSSLKRSSCYFGNEIVNFFKDFCILFRPFTVLSKSRFRKTYHLFIICCSASYSIIKCCKRNYFSLFNFFNRFIQMLPISRRFKKVFRFIQGICGFTNGYFNVPVEINALNGCYKAGGKIFCI